jgi:amino acid adenylation domain-containing protein
VSPTEEWDRSVPARFEKVAALCPSVTAVRGQGKIITYDELNRVANRIARSVHAVSGKDRGRGVLLFRHRPRALAAMLGVLKAGNAYVPLDPSYPRARMALILEDVRADLILTDGETAALAKEIAGTGCTVVDIDEIPGDVRDGNLDLVVPPDALAYIMYTSGSTGRPKGVMQTHRNLLHFIRSYSNGLRISGADRLSLLPSFSFSASLMDIYGALLNGAAVCLYDVREEGSARLADWLTEDGITVYHSVPSLFRHFAAGLAEAQRFPCLRIIDLGGEPVFDRDVELLHRHFSRECILVNHLAFTEASVVARHFIRQDSEVPAGRIPAGHPADGVEVSLVDEDGQPVDDGCTGEIVLRSEYLSPGYWGQPELTRAAFTPAPAGSELRAYQSGDLGRRRPDGLLEHLGRKDFRVKIRGFTVEVAETEAALLGLGGIKDVAVVTREASNGENRLVAYVVPDGGAEHRGAKLRELLREKLPDHMIPSEFLFLDALPLNPNGKVDRAALPMSGAVLHEPDRSRVGPRNDTERRLALLWARVLDADGFGVTDSFFDLGGDSLAAFRLFAGIETEFGKRLSPSVLLQSPTLERLAKVVESLEGETCAAPVRLIPLWAGSTRPPLFCIAPVADNALWYRELAPHLDREHPVFCIDSSEAVLDMTMAELAASCVESMRRVSSGPFCLIGYSSGGVVAFEVARQLHGMGLPVALLALLDTPCPVPDRKRGIGSRIAFVARAFRNFPGWLYYYWLGTENKAAQLNVVMRRTFGLHVDEASDPFAIVGKYLGKLSGWLKAYRPEPYPGRIVFCRARGQKLLRHLKLDEEWRNLADRIEVYAVPGHHEQILKEPYARVLASRLNGELRDVRA